MKNSKIKLMDKPLLFMCILYSIIGIFAVLSASSVSAVITYGQTPYYFFLKQLIIVTLSYLFGFIFVIRVPSSNYKKIFPWLLGGIIAALIYVLLRGQIVNSAKSWINLGFFKFQPSEFAKIVVIFLFGIFYGEENRFSDKKYGFLIPIMIAMVMFALIFIQPDLGTALILAFMAILMFFALPFKDNKLVTTLKILSGSALVFAIIFIQSGVGTNLLNDMQKSRLTFKAPCTRYLEETGYQACNGFIAFHNGGLFGKGIGKSTQKYLYLPESHTDFIFPIIVEETGLVGGVLIIIGFVYMLYRIFKIAKECTNLRNSIIVYGIGIYLLVHLLINFGGILALIPMTGTPVPFLSYGGTFAISLITLMIIVERIAIENNTQKEKINIKAL